ncbi:MAG: hypothetical protein LC748_15255, partial [Thermomicrobia bacterium]|nr:hypothetical protein [Thermomicrobia bacterium]
SGLFRSTDGGDTWEEMTRKPGLPPGLLGRMGIVASPAKAGRVWAIIEAQEGAVVRSDDYGETWQRVNEGGEVRQRPWYYMHIFADPQDAETVWIMNLNAWKSTDGGKTFTQVSGTHGDYHDLWIDPKNPRRMIQGNDGGATVSFNGGESWSSIYNQPTMEFYHVSVDNQVPYRLYGAQQDNSTISVPSRSKLAAITQVDTYEVGGGESGYIAVRPDDSNIIFAGNFAGMITRYDHRTGQRQNIHAWPEETAGWGAKDVKYRFQWTFPILISPHDADTLYITSQFVHRSTDEGQSWELISPDLTRNDPTKQEPSGGPITTDSNGMDWYCTIFAFAESPIARGVLWVGSDDGLIHVSRDGGRNWANVTPPAMPTWSLISIIEASPHDAGTAYVAVDRHRHDDFAPYLYKTNDYGTTWTTIVTGIPADEFTRVIREDPNRRGLLYAGTEAGVYVSFDDGAHWQSFRLGRPPGSMPVVPIHDMVVKDQDLVVATHGRAFWILDDLTPLYALTPEVLAKDAHLFAPRAAIRYRTLRGFEGGAGPGKTYQPVGTTTYTFWSDHAPERREGPETARRRPESTRWRGHLLPSPRETGGRRDPDLPRQGWKRDQNIPEQARRRASGASREKEEYARCGGRKARAKGGGAEPLRLEYALPGRAQCRGRDLSLQRRDGAARAPRHVSGPPHGRGCVFDPVIRHLQGPTRRGER